MNYGRELLRSLPDAQVLSLVRLATGHADATWHLAECGCCVCLHVDGEPSHGYLIGSDGEYDYVGREAAE